MRKWVLSMELYLPESVDNLRMDLQSKDMAPLMNISVRSVEMARYRLRKKMELGREVNLSEFLQKF